MTFRCGHSYTLSLGNVLPAFANEPLGHTPLYVYYPSVASHRVDALTTNVDINAMLCDVFNVEAPHRVHVASLVSLIE